MIAVLIGSQGSQLSRFEMDMSGGLVLVLGSLNIGRGGGGEAKNRAV